MTSGRPCVESTWVQLLESKSLSRFWFQIVNLHPYSTEMLYYEERKQIITLGINSMLSIHEIGDGEAAGSGGGAC